MAVYHAPKPNEAAYGVNKNHPDTFAIPYHAPKPNEAAYGVNKNHPDTFAIPPLLFPLPFWAYAIERLEVDSGDFVIDPAKNTKSQESEFPLEVAAIYARAG